MVENRTTLALGEGEIASQTVTDFLKENNHKLRGKSAKGINTTEQPTGDMVVADERRNSKRIPPRKKEVHRGTTSSLPSDSTTYNKREEELVIKQDKPEATATRQQPTKRRERYGLRTLRSVLVSEYKPPRRSTTGRQRK